ncbi:MAG: aldo/keto reductase [Nitrososphaerales archaeon]
MEYVPLGTAGAKVSRICLGAMSFGNGSEWMVEIDEAKPIIERALDLGINFFDTANVYSKGRSEEILGEVLQGHRNDVIIATKIYGKMSEGPNDQGLSRLHIRNQVRDSLGRLKTDHVDLYQIHRWDYETRIEETLSSLADLVRDGKVNYIGASSMFAWQFVKALYTSDKLGLIRFASMQNHYNLCYREEEREMIPLCKDQGIALIPWGPLAGGFLSGKYKRNEKPDSPRYRTSKLLSSRYFRPDDYDVLDAVQALAREKGTTPAQIALAWLLHRGVTAPIIGATKIRHVEEAIESIDIKLTSDDMKRLEAPYKLRQIEGHE